MNAALAFAAWLLSTSAALALFMAWRKIWRAPVCARPIVPVLRQRASMPRKLFS